MTYPEREERHTERKGGGGTEGRTKRERGRVRDRERLKLTSSVVGRQALDFQRERQREEREGGVAGGGGGGGH